MNYQPQVCVLIMLFIIQLPVFAGGRSEFLEDLSESLKDSFSLLLEPSMELQRFTGYRAGIESVARSPDGKTLLSGAYDSVRQWDVTIDEEP